MLGSRLKTNRVARGHHGLPVSSKTPPLPPSRWPSQVQRGSPMSSAAAPAVRGPGGHRGAERGRPNRPVTQQHARQLRGRRPAGARCPAQGRGGREGSGRVSDRPAAHKGVAAAHRPSASAARRHRKPDLKPKREPLSGALAGRDGAGRTTGPTSLCGRLRRTTSPVSLRGGAYVLPVPVVFAAGEASRPAAGRRSGAEKASRLAAVGLREARVQGAL